MGTAVVTGAGQGLGRAISKRLAADGHHIVAVDLNPESAAATGDMLGGQWRQCDVSNPESVAALAASLDRVDVLVNNAGIWIFAGMDDMTPEDVRRVLEVNVMGVFYCTQALAPLMGPGAAIVNLSSNAAYSNSPGVGIYPASKAAVESFTKQSALELARRGIRANAVGPGMIQTEGTQVNYEGELGRRRAKAVPLGRNGQPDDIADVVGFLASHDARYVTGQVIYVDGGLSAGRAAL
ncbi:MAG: SDR family oxidoreductase [Acidimicrobiia bacterium]|uniref:SDR family NAD(P)-dependent oxidoreductase n=1 Tax=Candidatus Poriferisocius sp. TaxID=3101276 RepID=UPI001361D832|nr:SDR family oxidoreductase [Acidimicrobiia bacterium]MYL09488.1 SDR family oxidoreductase [Acidimicrobiia bacterium]